MIELRGQTSLEFNLSDVVACRELSSFLELKGLESPYVGFGQVWTDVESGVEVDFRKIDDCCELARASVRCERQYLGLIESARLEYLGGCSDKSVGWVEFERELCRTDLYYLCKFVLGYGDLTFHLHYFMARTMEGLREGCRELREFPRDTFKSTIMGIGFCVQLILRNPAVTILYKSNSKDNAGKKISEAKSHFVKTDKLTTLFPEHVPRTKRDEGSGSEWRTPASKAVQQERTLTAAGVGTRKTSQHFDWIIGDDFWDEHSVTSPDVMEKTRRDMAGLQFLLKPNCSGGIVFLGTPYAHDDPTKDLLEDPSYRTVMVGGIVNCARTLFPESHIFFVDRLYASWKTSPYVFGCQILLHPSREDSRFKREWLIYEKFNNVKRLVREGKLTYRCMILVDAAVDDKKTSDNVAIGVVLARSDGKYHLVDGVLQRLNPDAFIKTVCGYWDKYSPEFVVRQKTSLETTLQTFFNQENKRRSRKGKGRVRFHAYSLHGREKKQRITVSLQPRFAKGQIVLDPGLPDLEAIEKQYLEHPNTKQDDWLDMLSVLDDQIVSRIPTLREVPSLPGGEIIPLTEEDVATQEMEGRRERARRGLAKLYGKAILNSSDVRRRVGRVVAK